MDIHLDRLKVLLKKRSIGGWILWALALGWKLLGDWQNVEWLQQHVFAKVWPKAVLHPDYITLIFIVGGFAWFSIIVLWPSKKSTKNAQVDDSSGPDLSLEWKHVKNSGDLVIIRNIGNATAFNIGLKFSWEKLFFEPPFNKNLLHPNQEITEYARFAERTGPTSVNLGWMDEILRIAYLQDRKPPLEVILSFSDGRVKFEKPFTFELGSGGTNTERIRITPGLRRMVQAAS